MSLTKYASLENVQILELKGSPDRARHASLGKLADFHAYRTDDGFLYARIRAISSRVNKNHDGWPAIELAGGQDVFDRHTSSADGFTVTADGSAQYGFSTFLGKPVFVDHHNTDPDRTRGAIVDAKLHVDDHKTSALDPYYSSKHVDPEHLPGTWIELLLEVDAKTFPKFAKAIVEGSRNPKKGIDGWSMGCDVEKSVCSICKTAATCPEEYCHHIKLKGAYFDWTDPHTKQKHSKLAYENCYGVKFFEISGVFDPADATALSLEHARTSKTQGETITQDPKEKGLKDLADEQADEWLGETEEGVKKRKKQDKEGTTHLAENPLPQSELYHSPEKIDTLREEEICPVCGSSMDEDTCDVCGYQEPPDGFGNPDLTKAKDVEPTEEPFADSGPEMKSEPTQLASPSPEPVNVPNNPTALAHVTSDMSWNVHAERTSARINKIEQPIVATDKPATNEPQETILSDQLRPVTSKVRTAEDFIAAAGATRRTQMNHTADAASGAPAVAKPDVKTDVLGVGGVDQASNEAASKADKQVDVLAIGGTGVESVSADKEGVNVDQGDEHSKNIEAIHTDTWSDGEGDSLGQRDPVTREPFPASEDGVRASHWIVEGHDDAPWPTDEIGGGSAVRGVQPIAESFGERVDVLDHVTSPANNSGATTTWTGTDGNGVLKQQDPVTGESIALSESGLAGKPNWSTSSHVFAAFKLADLEVAMGLTSAEQKYERAAELERETPTVLAAHLGYAQRVRRAARKTAGVQKLPVMGRSTTTEKEASTAPQSTADDSFMFGGV